MRHTLFRVAAALLVALFATTAVPRSASAQARIDPALTSALNAGGEVQAIVMFDHQPTAVDKARLVAAGATTVVVYQNWPWAGVVGPAAAINTISAFTDVQELQWAPPIDFYTHESIPLIGADKVWAPKSAGGLGFNGAGVGVAVVDSGINAMHPDLASRVVKNLKFVADYTVDVQNSDTTSGHGTHVAGTIAGDGTQSRTGTTDDLGGYGYYVGVAPGANLIGLGVGDGRNIIWSLAAFDWIATHHREYNIRVVSNSWGGAGGGPYNPSNSISIAAEDLAAQGITVVFAAGNDGNNAGTTSNATNNLNAYCGGSVICVASGQKDRALSTFSSTGAPDNSRTPTLTAPGTRICATRNPNGTTTGTTADAGLFPDTPAVRPEWKPWYTCISGTSMATPHVSGAIALMLQANSGLQPADVATILRTTADPMPGYQPYQVGAGYLDAFEATTIAKKTRATGTCVTKSGKQLPTIITQESWNGSVGLGVADAGAAAHDYHSFAVNAKALRVSVEIKWTTPQDLDLAVTYPDGSTAGSSGNLPGATSESTTIRDGNCSGSLPAGNWTSDAVGFVTVAENYTGTVEVEYLAK